MFLAKTEPGKSKSRQRKGRQVEAEVEDSRVKLKNRFSSRILVGNWQENLSILAMFCLRKNQVFGYVFGLKWAREMDRRQAERTKRRAGAQGAAAERMRVRRAPILLVFDRKRWKFPLIFLEKSMKNSKFLSQNQARKLEREGRKRVNGQRKRGRRKGKWEENDGKERKGWEREKLRKNEEKHTYEVKLQCERQRLSVSPLLSAQLKWI